MNKKIISVVSVIVIVLCIVLVVLAAVPFKVTEKPYVMDFDDGVSEVGLYTGKWIILGDHPANDHNSIFTYESDGVNVTISNAYMVDDQNPELRTFTRAADGKTLLEITYEYSDTQGNIKTHKYYAPDGDGYVIYKRTVSESADKALTYVIVYFENGAVEEMKVSEDNKITGSEKAVKFYNNTIDRVKAELDGVTGI